MDKWRAHRFLAVSHVRRTGNHDANTLLLPLAGVSCVQTYAMTCGWGSGKTVSEEIRTKEIGKMKRRTKTKVIRIGVDKGGTNEEF